MEDNEVLTTRSLNTDTLDNQTRDIAQQLIDEQDPTKIKDLTNLFNLNSQKRNVVRVLKLNDLLDKVTDEVSSRVEEMPELLRNEDLVKYMQVAEQAIDRATKSLNSVEEIPTIQLQQNNQFNINMDSGLDRESRQKVTDAVSAILSRMKDNDTIYLDSTDED